MLMSKNEIDWDCEHQLIVNRRVHHDSYIVKLISYVMYTDDNKFTKPIELKVLSKNNGSDSGNKELLDVGSESGEDETSDGSCCSGNCDEDSNEHENKSNDIDDGTRNHITKQTYNWKSMSGSENESVTSEMKVRQVNTSKDYQSVSATEQL